MFSIPTPFFLHDFEYFIQVSGLGKPLEILILLIFTFSELEYVEQPPLLVWGFRDDRGSQSTLTSAGVSRIAPPALAVPLLRARTASGTDPT